MRIIGLDPGYAITGAAVLDYSQSRFTVVEYAALTTSADTEFTERLKEIYRDLCYMLDKYKPDAMAAERLFFTNNVTTGIDVAQARGVMLLAAAERNIPVSQYTPLQVKQAVTGYGKATKKQVQAMTVSLLGLYETPKPDDVADALAVAICHAHCFNSRLGKSR